MPPFRDAPHDLQRAHDLYAALLGLDPAARPQDLLRTALELACDRLQARYGLIAVSRTAEGRQASPWLELRHARAPRARDRADAFPVSEGIIRHTLASDEAQRIVSALGDQRFMHRESVQDFGITSVLCAPIGSGPAGVIYLHDRASGFFSEDDLVAFRRFAAALAPAVDSVVLDRPLMAPAGSDEEPAGPRGPTWLQPLELDELVSWKQAKDLFARHYLAETVRHMGSKTVAAERIGLARGQFFNLWKRLGLEDPTGEDR